MFSAGGFGHGESVLTDTGLDSALGLCFAHNLEGAADRKGKPLKLWFFAFR